MESRSYRGFIVVQRLSRSWTWADANWARMASMNSFQSFSSPSMSSFRFLVSFFLESFSTQSELQGNQITPLELKIFSGQLRWIGKSRFIPHFFALIWFVWRISHYNTNMLASLLVLRSIYIELTLKLPFIPTTKQRLKVGNSLRDFIWPIQ